MKKIALIIFTAFLLVPLFAEAAVIPVSWFRDTTGGFLYPLISTDSLRIIQLGGSGTKCLQTDNDGDVSVASAACGSGSGSGGGTWSTTTSSVAGQFLNYPNEATDIVTIGSTSATSSSKFFFDPNLPIATLFAPLLVTGSTTLQSFFGTNYLALGSTTLQNFTSQNATSSNATSTTFSSGTICIAGDCRTAWPTAGSFAWPFTKQAGNEQATTTIIEFVGGLLSNASSTFTSAPTISPLTSALILTDGAGLTAEYAGTSCTNQFPRSLSALGAATCATVVATDVDLADLTATNGTLTFSGTYDGQVARTIGLNLGNANVWTALQTFSNADSLLATGSTTLQNFTAQNGTTTNATSTTFSSGTICLSGDCKTAWPSGGSTFAWPFTKLSTNEQATSTVLAFLAGDITASSTNTGDSIVLGHASTTGNVFAGGNVNFNGELLPDGLTCSNGQILKKTGANDWDCATDDTGAGGGISWPFTKLATGEQATSTIMAWLNGFLSTASSTFTVGPTILASTTLQNFTASNSTTTSATTTNFFATTASTTNLTLDKLFFNNVIPTISGQVGFNGASSSLSYYSNGQLGNIPKVVASGAGTQAHTNGAAEDDDFTAIYTIPANALFTNKMYRVSFVYEYVSGVASIQATDYLKIGSTKVAIGGAIDATNSTTRSTGFTYLITGRAAAGAAANVTTGTMTSRLQNGGSNSVDQPVALATNGTLAITPGVTWSAGGGTESVELQSWLVEELN